MINESIVKDVATDTPDRWDAEIKKAQSLTGVRKFKEAYAVIEPLVKEMDEIDRSGKYTNTADTIYADIGGAFEVTLYLSYIHERILGTINPYVPDSIEHIASQYKKAADEKQLESLSLKGVDDIPISYIYFLAGCILFDLRRFDEAREALRKARKWGPTTFIYYGEYSETFKIIGDMNGFLAATIDAHTVAFRPQDIARCMRNLGFYFTEKQQWRKAYALYRKSLEFDPYNQNAKYEMEYIKRYSPNAAQKLPDAELKKLSQKYPIFNGASPFVVAVAINSGRSMMESGAYEAAVSYLSIAYDASHDQKVKLMLEDAKRKAVAGA